ncbi:hypothetical protein ACOMHN_036810 [Nucella lapillus]
MEVKTLASPEGVTPVAKHRPFNTAVEDEQSQTEHSPQHAGCVCRHDGLMPFASSLCDSRETRGSIELVLSLEFRREGSGYLPYFRIGV